MKANLDFSPGLVPNEHQFKDPFFQRFTLRNAPKPLRLSETVSKNYVFPTMYADVSCAIGIFKCSFDAALKLMPDPALKPVSMLGGKSLVIFSCYEYRTVMNVAPYNEIAMTIPVLAGGLRLPVLPMVLSGAFSNFGYYVFSMPVTSKENELRGRNIWGLPKVTQDIDITVRDGYSTTVARDERGEAYFELNVPLNGGSQKSFDVTGRLYSKLDGRLLRAQTNFKGDFNVVKRAEPGREYLKIGNGPAAATLRSLELDKTPFQLRHTPGMNAAFDLPIM
ncbi:MAG: acetoacetate decarboxylase family protein [Deltaproteobacteria bacterium]|nr:acetoacetate decarboxylase family protein [Deltaproteobacteria bacterium]